MAVFVLPLNSFTNPVIYTLRPAWQDMTKAKNMKKMKQEKEYQEILRRSN